MFQDFYGILSLSAEERQLLAAVRRHGGAWSGSPLHQAVAALGAPALAPAAAAASTTLAAAPSGAEAGLPAAHDPSAPVEISLWGLLLAAAPLLVIGAISVHLRLGLHRKLAVGAVRCVLQLSMLGYLLVPIFVANRWWLSALYSVFMCLVAAAEAVSRPSHHYAGMLPQVLAAMGVACAAMITFGLAVVIRVSPWYNAQYLIPMLGMLLGNACSSVAVGLSAVLEELSAGRDKVEALLVLGASRVEATRDVVRRAVRLALTPLLNSLNVVGIVSIPGMMTGQILGGSDPAVAARYQIIIFFLMATAVGLSALATVYAAVLSVCDAKHRLRGDRLKARAVAGGGVVGWLGAQAKEGWDGARGGAAAAVGRVRRAVQGSGYSSRSRHQYFSFRSPQAQSSGERTPVRGGPGSPAPARLRGVLVEQQERGGGGAAAELLAAPLLAEEEPHTP